MTSGKSEFYCSNSDVIIAPLIGKVALVQKPFIPRDKKSLGTRNPSGQEIPWDKKSPGTRNPPGQKSPGKSRAGTASIYIKEWPFYSFLT